MDRRTNCAVCLGCLPHLPPSERPCSRTTRPPLWRWLESAEIREAPERNPLGWGKLLRFPILPFQKAREVGSDSGPGVCRGVAKSLGTLEFDSDCSRSNPCLGVAKLPQFSHLYMGLILQKESMRIK